MKEPSLWRISKESTTKNEVYRFLWLRSMFGHPTCIRLDIDVNGKGSLTFKETNGFGSGATGALCTWKIIDLDQFQTTKFRKEISRIDFWNGSSTREVGGLDGARWVLEGAKGKDYKILDYFTPAKGNIEIVTRMLLNFSKSKVAKSVNFLNLNEVANPPVFP